MTTTGGLRSAWIEDAEVQKATSPYELSFVLVQSKPGRSDRGIFSEQTPLGGACHVTSPEVPLGIDSFACVVSGLSTSEFSSAVRANGATLLHPEQMLFALTTICPTDLPISFGFSRGSGGTAESARAALSSLRLGYQEPQDLPFKYSLPGALTIETVNQIRCTLANALKTGPPVWATPSPGKAVLLWEDDVARQAVESLLALIENAMPLPSPPRADHQWIDVQNSKENKKKNEHGGDNAVALRQNDNNVVALQPLKIELAQAEARVARARSHRVEKRDHGFECPDCGEQFHSWEACHEHYEMTCHLDVSDSEAIEEAKTLSQPLLYQCLECKAQFPDWDSCKAHLVCQGCLAWADEQTQMDLCVPEE